MKRLLLVSTAMTLAITSFAQSGRMMSAKEAIKQRDLKKSEISSSPVKSVKTPSISRNGAGNTNQAVTVIPIGTSANAFGTIGIRSNIDYNADINTVSFIHRADPSNGLGTTSGQLYFDMSTDGGSTWSSNVGQLYTHPGAYGGRYPNAVLYNPSGNTTPANAFLSYYAPCTDGAGWAADVHGSATLNTGAFTSTETVEVHPYPDGTDLVVPDGMVIAQATRETYVYDPTLPDELTTSYTGVLQVRHGVWNGTNDMTYNTIFVNLPVSTDLSDGTSDYGSSSNVSFANDGMTGYSLVIGHYDYVLNPDSSYFLIISKTTDGGLTWSAPFYLTYAALDGLLNTSGAGKYMNWVDCDGVVDMNGNLHVITTIGALAGAYSISTAPGTVGIFDVYTSNGGTTWHAEFLSEPQAFAIDYTSAGGDDTYYQRGQASRTWSGDKVFFSWLDTDTTTFGTTDNAFPDLHVRAFNVVTNQWTAEMNLTAGSAADGAVTYGNVGPYVIPVTGGNKIAASYVSIITDIAGPVQHNYMDGLEIPDNAFNVAPNPVTLTMVPTAIESPGTISNATSIYPNPATTECFVGITLKEAANVSVTFTNTIGQVVSSQKIGHLDAGQNTLKLDTRNLNKGIYMVSVLAGENKIVRKLTVN